MLPSSTNQHRVRRKREKKTPNRQSSATPRSGSLASSGLINCFPLSGESLVFLPCKGKTSLSKVRHTVLMKTVGLIWLMHTFTARALPLQSFITCSAIVSDKFICHRLYPRCRKKLAIFSVPGIKNADRL